MQDNILMKYNFNVQEFEQALKGYENNCGIKIIETGEAIPTVNKLEAMTKSTDSFNYLTSALANIIKICGHEASVRESAGIYDSELVGGFKYPNVRFAGEKSKIDISISLFGYFYISTKLDNVNNIRLMPDKFWQEISKLSELGKFEYIEENQIAPHLKKKYPHLFKSRGSIYRLTRNYFINQMETGNCDSLGSIRLRWDRDTASEVLVANFINAFKSMYTINYMLWKVENKQ